MTVHQDYIFGATLFVAALAMVLPASAHAQSRDELAAAARAFDEAALRAEDNNAKPMPVRKWMGPIRLGFANPTAAPSLVDLSRDGVRSLAVEAGIAVGEAASSGPDANFVVIFDENGLHGQSGECSAKGWWDKNKIIYKAELRINPTRMRDVDRCAIHEPMHAFGFFSHPHAALSVLSYVYKAQRTLTPLDRHLLHTLYDPRLSPGMASGPASQLACRILGERMGAVATDIDAVCRDRKGPMPAI